MTTANKRIASPGSRPAIQHPAEGSGSASRRPVTASMRTSDKAGARPLILGQGRHTYEVVTDWPVLPQEVRFGYTHGVCEDSQGRILIHNQSKDAICIFDPDGRFITSWGSQFQVGAHGMTIHQEEGTEYLYLAATSLHRIYKTTLDGEVIWEKGPPPLAEVYADESQYIPTNIAFAPNGDFYVADGYGQHWIHHYNPQGEYVRSWGGKGSEPGRLNCPHGVWVDTRHGEPRVVVADRANVRLQYFTLDGRHIGFVTDDLRHPCHFRIRGTDLLIPDLYGRVTIFDRDNRLVTHLGIDCEVEPWIRVEGYPNLPHDQRMVGKFISPHDACWDSRGDLYVVEWVSDGRVTKLRHVDA